MPHRHFPVWVEIIPSLPSQELLTYWYACTKFGKLTVRNNIVATRCHILNLKYTKSNFSWGSAADPAGELTVLPQTSQVDLWGLVLCEGRGEKGK